MRIYLAFQAHRLKYFVASFLCGVTFISNFLVLFMWQGTVLCHSSILPESIRSFIISLLFSFGTFSNNYEKKLFLLIALFVVIIYLILFYLLIKSNNSFAKLISNPLRILYSFKAESLSPIL